MMAAIISWGLRPPIQRFSRVTAWVLRVRLRPYWRALADYGFPLASRIASTTSTWGTTWLGLLRNCSSLRPRRGERRLGWNSGDKWWHSWQGTRETCEAHAIQQAVCSRCHHTCGADKLRTQLP